MTVTGGGDHMARRIAVVGLGYVGLPVAVAFARAGFDVTGYDVDAARVADLRAGRDRTGEVAPADLRAAPARYTDDPADLSRADFFIVTVPTPIDAAKRPDLSALLSASRTVGAAMRAGAPGSSGAPGRPIVVFESTVYPGATEEDCVPALEAASGLRCGADFAVGYSPERINPGDRVHRFETVTKVVSGMDAATLDAVAAVYGAVVAAGVHRAPSIRVAEAAKVIENTQRDLNIAFVNELSQICHRLGLDTHDVLAAAGTKWNFLPFSPGLVGGHCIGVDPYYLTHRAERAGHHPQLILAGRRINDGMGAAVAAACLRNLMRHSDWTRPLAVTVLGLTFKEDVPDLRNSRVFDVVAELRDGGAAVRAHDPHADPAAAAAMGVAPVALDALEPADAVVLAVPHADYVAGGWPLVQGLLRDGRGLVCDVRAVLPWADRPDGVRLWRL